MAILLIAVSGAVVPIALFVQTKRSVLRRDILREYLFNPQSFLCVSF